MDDFYLSILGNDWIVIAFVAIVLFLGPKRLPEISKRIGKLVGKYSETKNMVKNEFQNASHTLSIQGPVETERQKLEMVAKSLDIDILNKSDEELRNLISSKLGSSSAGKN